MSTEEKFERMQNEIDYLRKRIEVLEGRCVCPVPRPKQPWDYDGARPWWKEVDQRKWWV